MGYARLSQNNHWHVQDLWLGTGLVGELRRQSTQVVVPIGECKSWVQRSGLDINSVSLGMDVDLIWGKTDWARFQHPLLLVRSRVSVGQTGLGLCTH